MIRFSVYYKIPSNLAAHLALAFFPANILLLNSHGLLYYCIAFELS